MWRPRAQRCNTRVSRFVNKLIRNQEPWKAWLHSMSSTTFRDSHVTRLSEGRLTSLEYRNVFTQIAKRGKLGIKDANQDIINLNDRSIGDDTAFE